MAVKTQKTKKKSKKVRSYSFKLADGKVHRFTPTEKVMLKEEGSSEKKEMYFFFTKDFKKQKLPAPYMQVIVYNRKVIGDFAYSHDEAEKIRNFFTGAHLLGQSFPGI
jgi:hypothetical protein